MVAPFSKFYGKIWVSFCLTKRFFLEVSFSSFYATISENFERFQYCNFETYFLENETFKKLEYRFLVERTKIENASFPYKTAISEANVKTNRTVTTKWAYHRERSFASNYFIF